MSKMTIAHVLIAQQLEDRKQETSVRERKKRRIIKRKYNRLKRGGQ
jgi:hypothetical protein